jgi:hypothetical protein
MTEGDDKVLITKNKDNKISFKVRTRRRRGYAPDDYVKVINPKDYVQLSLLLEDLDLLIGAPIEKAFREYINRKEKGFPF